MTDLDDLERKHNVLSREAIELVESLAEQLESARYTDPSETRATVHEAITQITRVGCRMLGASRLLIDSGFCPECAALLRCVFELSVDAAFILSLNGETRREAARCYIFSRWLRLDRRSTEILERVRPAEYAELLNNFPKKALDPREHWSGGSKGDARRRAKAYWEEIVGGDPENRFKHVLFEVGSLVAHSDPGAWALYPIDERTARVREGPRMRAKWLTTVTVAGMMLAHLASRLLNADAKDRAASLLEQLMEVADLPLSQDNEERNEAKE